jgi:signal transduction histidine kinase
VNLIDNAIRHTPPGGSVKISLHNCQNTVVVDVADTGRGIPADELEHVFDRFYQVKKHEHQSTGGVGLGLAIAKRIIDLHASHIVVESKPDTGTRVDFTLPTYAA